MAHASFHYDGHEDDIHDAIDHLVAALAGKETDHTGAAERVKRVMARALLKEIQQAFAAKSLGGTDAMGVTWPALAESTRKAKAKKGKLPLILRDTDELYRSLDPHLDGTGDQIIDVSPGKMTVGSAIKYLKHHQDAGPRKPGKSGLPRLPRRQVFPDEGRPVPKAWRDAMVEAVKVELTKKSFWSLLLGDKLS